MSLRTWQKWYDKMAPIWPQHCSKVFSWPLTRDKKRKRCRKLTAKRSTFDTMKVKSIKLLLSCQLESEWTLTEWSIECGSSKKVPFRAALEGGGVPLKNLHPKHTRVPLSNFLWKLSCTFHWHAWCMRSDHDGYSGQTEVLCSESAPQISGLGTLR